MLITDADWYIVDPRTSHDGLVEIEKSVWLALNVTVLKDVTISENTLVAAGSIVILLQKLLRGLALLILSNRQER